MAHLVCEDCGMIPDAGAPHLCGGHLARLALFEGCDANQLDPIASRLVTRRLAAGEALMKEGERGDTFALVIAGELAITRSLPEMHLGDATEGSIVGELAVLRHQPRMATVTATRPSTAAVGTAGVLAEMLELPGICERLRLLASARLAHDMRPVPTALRDGTAVLLRPLLPEDRPLYETVVRNLSPEFLRRRFFSSSAPAPSLVDYLVDIDYADHFAWVALQRDNPASGLAVGRYIRAPDPEEAEVAFGVTDPQQGRGIGTLLLGAVGVAAGEAGVRRLVASVLEDNVPMRAVFAKAGGTASFAEPGVLSIAMDAGAAAALLGEDLRRDLAGAAHDVVTAASLALTAPRLLSPPPGGPGC
ncbi:MAG: GNAT family N-acetyltransferase [Acidimicrobiales bacterium]